VPLDVLHVGRYRSNGLLTACTANLVSGVAVAARGQGQRSEADGSRGLYLSEQRHIYSFMFIVVGGADAVKLSKQSR
jgi:hypothetical protein